MLKKIWQDPVWSKVIATVIVGLCSALIGLSLHFRQQANSDKTAINEPARIRAASNELIRLGEPQVIEEHKAFIDPQTGFVFTTQEIDDGTFLWGLTPRSDGVLSWYKLPNGEIGDVYRYPAGHRVPFDFSGRKFFFVIVDIDYKSKRTTVRVDELISERDKVSSSAEHK